MRIAGEFIQSYREIPMRQLILKGKEYLNDRDWDKIFNEFNTYISNRNLPFKIWDYRDYIKSIN